MFLAGSYYYGVCANMEAEIKALLDGISMLQEYGLQVYQLVIEIDSKLLVDMVKQKVKVSWKFWSLFDQIHSILRRFAFEIQHTYRERNMVVDSLTNKGVTDRGSFIYDSMKDIPIHIRLLMQRDSKNIHSLRKHLKQIL